MAIAIEVPRPPLVHVLLATIAIAPALICDPPKRDERTTRCASHVAVLPEAAKLVPYSDDIVIDPGDHPDMQEWPRGMVIKPPQIDDGIHAQLTVPSPIDSLLSALGLPWRVSTTSSDASLL